MFKFFKSNKNTPQILEKAIYENYDLEYIKQDFIKKINRYKIEVNTKSEWAINFDKCLLNVHSNLTIQEEIYLTDSLFKNRPDYYIAEKLNLNKDNLKIIKSSCLVKIWNEFHSKNKLNVSL